jgi:hypothetical protein
MTITPVSTRTMNLAHLVEQNARRLGDLPAFVWGDQTWTWDVSVHSAEQTPTAEGR